ncbi:MAG: hypothetical protein WAQ52_07905 [Terriglobales bacterium]
MASKHRTILEFGAQPTALPPDPQPATSEATADIVEVLLAESLAKDDLLGRLCGSLVVAKIRRGGQR